MGDYRVLLLRDRAERLLHNEQLRRAYLGR